MLSFIAVTAGKKNLWLGRAAGLLKLFAKEGTYLAIEAPCFSGGLSIQS